MPVGLRNRPPPAQCAGRRRTFFSNTSFPCRLPYPSATDTAALSHYYVKAPPALPKGSGYGSALRYSFGPPFGGQGASFRWPWRRGPPLTIPNREVKPVCADGTATPSGRVGRRLFLKALIMYMVGAFFCTGSKCGSRMGRWRAQSRETLQSGSIATLNHW